MIISKSLIWVSERANAQVVTCPARITRVFVFLVALALSSQMPASTPEITFPDLSLIVQRLEDVQHQNRARSRPYESRCGSVRGSPVLRFTLLSQSGPTGRTSDSECLFGAEFFCHANLHVQKGGELDSSGKPPCPGLRPPDNGHGPILQKGADKFAIYLQAAVVTDEAFLLEQIHKFTDSCAGGSDHLREGCLAHLQGVLWL